MIVSTYVYNPQNVPYPELTDSVIPDESPGCLPIDPSRVAS